ncbi:GNAT family N-acetyltransferase [Nitratireductor basaltis]|uniref:N-acetyltransferase GCN5 n=1 Tax=Nitratireductor basaltis TaxID=472175 RepID=A0A084U6B3_9HYPH|nr:GNAT family N-acetyltransferase [Nitratireductor basaltis]KFB08499.1 N-acetyltransferase GCN5 [Nitratireductor basaltis]
MSKADAIGLKPVGPEHYALLREWLARTHVREWWGEADEELGFIKDMVEGRDTTRPFILEFEGREIGYMQYWFVADNRTPALVAEHPWLLKVPHDAVGVDITIGEEQLVSKGIGTAAVKKMVARLRAHGHRAIIIDPDRGNARAIRAYEKAGFRPIPHLEGRSGDVLLMQHHEENEIHS